MFLINDTVVRLRLSLDCRLIDYLSVEFLFVY